SNTATITVPVSPDPDAPSGLTASTTGTLTILLSWTNNLTGAAGFRVERKVSDTAPFAEIGSTDAMTTTFVDPGVPAGAIYVYRVRAIGADGQPTSYSNEAVGAQLSDVAPSDLSAASGGGIALNLSWTNNSPNAVQFSVERKTGIGGTYAEIVRVSVP